MSELLLPMIKSHKLMVWVLSSKSVNDTNRNNNATQDGNIKTTDIQKTETAQTNNR